MKISEQDIIKAFGQNYKNFMKKVDFHVILLKMFMHMILVKFYLNQR